MRLGIGISEIVLILVIIIIFVDPKQVPDLLKKGMKIAGQVRREIRKFLDEISKN